MGDSWTRSGGLGTARRAHGGRPLPAHTAALRELEKGGPPLGGPIKIFSSHVGPLSGMPSCRTQRYLVALTLVHWAGSGL